MSEAAAKNAGEEGMRQRSIKEILRKLNNGVITKKSADKQLKDKGHPGIDLVEQSEIGKAEHKARLDKLDSNALLAHMTKHAGEAKLPGEKTSAGDIKGHAMRTASRLGHKDNSAYWNKIKHLVKEDISLDESSVASGDLIKKIGKKYGVDFEDADGRAAFKAMHACYEEGYDAAEVDALRKQKGKK